MTLIIATVLHIVSGITLSGSPAVLTYIERGAPTVCALQSIDWEGAAWRAEVGGCLSDRIYSGNFE